MPHQKGIKTIAQNRKAWHDYFVEDKVECGVVLFGTEVKSVRQGKVNLTDPERRSLGRGAAYQPLRTGQHL